MSGETVLVIDDSPTILKVVQLVLSKAGYVVETAPDGEAGMAAAKSLKPDLILLDFVMPKMNGYQVCRELAQDADLKDIAVVLMSAKGDQVGERFVKVMGIVDYITKPFSPEAITAVVQHSIAKYGKRGPDDYTKPILKSSVDAFAKSRSDALAAEAEETQRSEALGAFRAAVATAVAAPLSKKLTADGPFDADSLAEATRDALSDEVISDLLQAAEPALDVGAGQPSLRGDVRVVPIAEVLQLLETQKQSGLLRIARAGSHVEASFRDGRIDLTSATGVDEEFLLGRFIVDNALMASDDLDGFLESRTEGGTKLMGSQLVKLGYLSSDELKIALTAQTRELIYEVLRWNFGSFEFVRTRDLPANALDASLQLEVESILMEGFRRVDEWHLIEREVDDFDRVFLRNEDALVHMGRGRLTREELSILELVNGKNTVKEIIRGSRMGSFDVSKMLYRLLSIKLIRPRVQPIAV